jgi:hypothetical protein
LIRWMRRVCVVFDDALRYDTALGKALAAGSSG